MSSTAHEAPSFKLCIQLIHPYHAPRNHLSTAMGSATGSRPPSCSLGPILQGNALKKVATSLKQALLQPWLSDCRWNTLFKYSRQPRSSGSSTQHWLSAPLQNADKDDGKDANPVTASFSSSTDSSLWRACRQRYATYSQSATTTKVRSFK